MINTLLYLCRVFTNTSVKVLINQKHLEKLKSFSNRIILQIHIIGQHLYFRVMFLKFKMSKQHHQTIFYLFYSGFLLLFLPYILHAENLPCVNFVSPLHICFLFLSHFIYYSLSININKELQCPLKRIKLLL